MNILRISGGAVGVGGGGGGELFILEKSQRERTVKGVWGGRRGLGDLVKGEAQSCMDNKTQGKLLEGRAYIWMITESNRDKKHGRCDGPD